MKMSLPKCWLKCVEKSHEPFILRDGQEVLFGRGPDTKIKDSRCSRNQVKFVADCKKYSVKVTQIGRNNCGLNGLSLEKDHPVTMKHGDRIEILLGQYVHVVEFDPPPPSSSSSNKQSQNQDKPSNNISDSEEEEPQPKKTRNDNRKSDNATAHKYWESIDHGELLIYTPERVQPSNLIAAYDLDGTIITTTTNSVFAKHKDDWKLLYPEKILSKLRDLHGKNYKIVFFTNQAGISTRKTNVTEFKEKIQNIVKKINLPIQVFIATNHSMYRKPCTGMWDVLMEKNNNIKIDMTKSFYVGDAAGREASSSHKKKDFSQADLLFAKNLNLHFETPEGHFLNQKEPQFKISVFNPNDIPYDIPLCEPSWGQVIATKIEVVILVGLPGSGKTTFAKTHLVPAGYFHVNRDTLGTWNKCVAETEQALRAKRKVVIDNTNPDAESRRRYIDVAKNYTSIVRCFIMNTSFQHARHNNKFRQLTDPSHAVISDAVLHTYNNKYEEPTKSEGFQEILKINFWPTFKNPKLEKLYKLFLLEK